MNFINDSQRYQCCLFNPSKNYAVLRQNPSLNQQSQKNSKGSQNNCNLNAQSKKLMNRKKSQQVYFIQKANSFDKNFNCLKTFNQYQDQDIRSDTFSQFNQNEVKDKKKLSCKHIKDSLHCKLKGLGNKNPKKQSEQKQKLMFNNNVNKFQVFLLNLQTNKPIQNKINGQYYNNKQQNRKTPITTVNSLKFYQQRNPSFNFLNEIKSSNTPLQNQMFKKKNLHSLKTVKSLECLSNYQKLKSSGQVTTLHSLKSTNFFQNYDFLNSNIKVNEQLKGQKHTQKQFKQKEVNAQLKNFENKQSKIAQTKKEDFLVQQKKGDILAQSKKGSFLVSSKKGSFLTQSKRAQFYNSEFFQSKKTKKSGKSPLLIALRTAKSFDSNFDDQQESEPSIVIGHYSSEQHIDHLI